MNFPHQNLLCYDPQLRNSETECRSDNTIINDLSDKYEDGGIFKNACSYINERAS